MAAESMLDWLREFEGYRGLLVLADAESGNARIVTFWDNLEAIERSDRSRREVRESMIATAGAELASVERFELFFGEELAEVQAEVSSDPDTPLAARFTSFEGPPESIEEGLRTFREDRLATRQSLSDQDHRLVEGRHRLFDGLRQQMLCDAVDRVRY